MSPLNRLAAVVLVLSPLAATSTMTSIEGRWLSGDGDGWIEIILEGDSLVGRIAGSPNDRPGDAPSYDDLSTAPALRGRSLKGLTIVSGFRYDADDRVWPDLASLRAR